MKPNLFEISTKELTQDAFIVWLLKWADEDNSSENTGLNSCGKDFILSLIKKVYPGFSDAIVTVKSGRQLNHIDIWAIVNDEYFIIIEDKTETTKHGSQLLNYKKWAEKHYALYKPILIFLKTGNESFTRLSSIEEKEGYKWFSRQEFLNILEKHTIQNDIYMDYLFHLQRIEQETQSYHTKKGLASWFGSQGFFLFLQSHIKKYTDWAYVPNQSGGFMGFFYYWRKYQKTGQELNLQIENHFNKGLKVVVKIGGKYWERKTGTLYSLLKNLQETGKQQGIDFCKPARYKIGNTTTVAEVKTPIQFDETETFNQDEFLALISSLEKVIDTVTQGGI
jgi:hypothetical protein